MAGDEYIKSIEVRMDRLDDKIDKLTQEVYKNNGIKRLVQANAEAIGKLSGNLAEHCAEGKGEQKAMVAFVNKKRTGFSQVMTLISAIIGCAGVIVAILAIVISRSQ